MPILLASDDWGDLLCALRNSTQKSAEEQNAGYLECTEEMAGLRVTCIVHLRRHPRNKQLTWISAWKVEGKSKGFNAVRGALREVCNQVQTPVKEPVKQKREIFLIEHW